jgi:cytochrome c oxidase cbb3-type subunit II
VITRIWFVLLGAIAIMTFALTLLVVTPQVLLDDVQAPLGLAPYTESELRGRMVYVREGCVYCHSQQVRDPTLATDVQRGWGRPTVPGDYVFDGPHLLGTMRTGPDLINVGARLPDRQWHLLHLYQPRALVEWSVMPSFRYLFFEQDESAVVWTEAVALPPGLQKPGKKVVARADAVALVDYLLSLDRTYPLEVTDAR